MLARASLLTSCLHAYPAPVTFMVYLCDVEEGGYTFFPRARPNTASGLDDEFNDAAASERPKAATSAGMRIQPRKARAACRCHVAPVDALADVRLTRRACECIGARAGLLECPRRTRGRRVAARGAAGAAGPEDDCHQMADLRDGRCRRVMRQADNTMRAQATLSNACNSAMYSDTTRFVGCASERLVGRSRLLRHRRAKQARARSSARSRFKQTATTAFQPPPPPR